MTLEAQDLLNSAVGRRLCLAYLETLVDPAQPHRADDHSAAARFQYALRTASMVLDLSSGKSTVFGWDPHGNMLDHESFLAHLIEEAEERGLVGATSGSALAHALDQVELQDITDLVLMQALAQACANVHFWGQTPDGEEILCMLPEMHTALLRVAEHIIESPATSWWYEPWAPREQWLVRTYSGTHQQVSADVLPRLKQEHESLAVLIDASFQQVEQERTASQERATSPQLVFGGEWWSFPPYRLEKTTSMLPGIGPVGVYCEEDSAGSSEKIAWKVESTGGRIFEIAHANDWARLCSWYPFDVTATRLDTWGTDTGRRGKWVIPDWIKVAHDFDGVHLTAAAYIALSGTVIPVPDLGPSNEWASTITGWTPDWTYHFVPLTVSHRTCQVWQIDDSANGQTLWAPTSNADKGLRDLRSNGQ